MQEQAEVIIHSTAVGYDDSPTGGGTCEEALASLGQTDGARDAVLRLSRRLSNLLSPPIMALIAFWILAAIYAPAHRLQVFLVCALTQSIIPIIYLKTAVHRGWLGDIDMSERAERRLGLPLLGIVYLFGSLIAFATGAPAAIITVCLCTIAVLGGIWASNLIYKASGHVAGVSAYMVVLSLFGHEPLHVGLFVIPALSWARVRSGAHTVAQTIWGFLIGSGLTYLLWAGIYKPFIAS